jgi:hypothetical protein
LGSNTILNFKPEDDGITHINVYSKGKTELGRFLSNFADCNVMTEDGPFRTIEGYWYWLSVSKEDPWRDKLRLTSGWDSKKLGRELRGNDWLKTQSFKDKIRKAIFIKIVSNQAMLEQFVVTKLPFTHYYIYGNKIMDVPEAGWIMEFIEWLRADMTHGEQ